MSQVPVIFDRTLVRKRRDRAALTFTDHDFLFQEVGERIEERLADVRRSFSRVLDLGCHTGGLSPKVDASNSEAFVILSDLSHSMVSRVSPSRAGRKAVVADEELLPFAPASFDLIVSTLSLHWVNDLPGTLIQIQKCLSPDGLFLAAMFGGGTLGELRAALSEAELQREGGVRPRISPFADVRDCGNLLQRAGFTMPVADVETITVRYRDPIKLLKDLRGMGEANAVASQPRHFTRRGTILDALSRLADAYEDGIPVTFDVVFLSGWAPDASQPKPKARGSATVRLTDALSPK
jgi:SAM-dependent methyltransferase